MLMLGGEIFTGGPQNPMTLVFYCFLPVTLWMLAQVQSRDKQEIARLRAHVHRLQEALGSLDLPSEESPHTAAASR